MTLSVSKMHTLMLLAIGLFSVLDAAEVNAKANPIRKVVTMLQTMSDKVKAEGEQEESLYNRFVCYCKNGKGELGDTIAAAEAKVPQVSSAIEEQEGVKAQLDEDLKAHGADREAAKSSLAAAIALRAKQAATHASRKADYETNIEALKKAHTAVEKGMGGFLQTGAAQALRKLMQERESMIDVDRQAVLAFLSGGASYSPQSGQITGILKQLHDEFSQSLADETATEEASIKDHNALAAAKKKEIASLTAAIETKTVRRGEVAVDIVNQKNDLSDTQQALLADRTFLKELDAGCSTKEAEWNERSKTRSSELVALAETIKLLNDDDALELFKKAVPKGDGTSRSFMQVAGRSMEQVRARALAAVRKARGRVPGIDLIAVALHSKTAAFEKVQAMIDEMVEVLKAEQGGDDKKKSYCENQFDASDDKKKSLERTISQEEAAIADANEGIATLTNELKELAAGIAELDKSVAEATEQRKQEHADYKELIALDTQAKDLLGVAKNRLNQFYNPKLYVPPAKKELTREDRVYQDSGLAAAEPAFVQLGASTRHGVAPAPPPDTFDAYNKKSEDSNSVIAMVDLLVKDLDKEMAEAETDENDAQKDYETMLADAKAKRAADSMSVAEKEGAKADTEQALQSHTDGHAAATNEHMANAEYISGLHGECDWLQQNYEVRKTARAGEVESLKNAKAVLAGADYSLVQVHDDSKKRYLRG